jgi:hypothetical protein
VSEVCHKFRPESFIIKLVHSRCGRICGLVTIDFGANEVDVLYDPVIYLRSLHKGEGEGDVAKGGYDSHIIEIHNLIETKFTYKLVSFGSITIKGGGYSSFERTILYSWDIRCYSGCWRGCCASWWSSSRWSATSSWWSGRWTSAYRLSWGCTSAWRS